MAKLGFEMKADFKDDFSHHGHGEASYEQGAAGSKQLVPVPKAKGALGGHWPVSQGLL